jgi:membrane protein
MVTGTAMLWTVAKEAAGNWSNHKDSRQGAALAYYSVFSLGPIIVIAIAVAGFFFGREAVSGQVGLNKGYAGRRRRKGRSGHAGGCCSAPRRYYCDSARNRRSFVRRDWCSVQLKDALNTVWEVGETPGHGIWHFMRSYVASLAAVLALGFLLMVPLVVTAGLAAFGKYAAPHVQEWLLHLTMARQARFKLGPIAESLSLNH